MADEDSTGQRIVTRAEAKAAGLKRYFPGSHCKSGHSSERLVSNGSCLTCCSEKALAAYWENRDENLRRQKQLRDQPGYYERRREKRHSKDPALAQRVAAEQAEMAARAEAAHRNESSYLSKRQCSRGHVPIRFVADGKCLECNRIACAARSAKKRFPKAGEMAPAISSLLELIRIIASEKMKAEALAKRESRQARQKAMAAGLKTYVGKVCPRGHDGVRSTSDGTCLACSRENSSSDAKKLYDKRYFERNRAAIVGRTRAYAARNSARISLNARAWTERNPEKRRAISKAYKSRRRQLEAGGDSTAAIARWESKAEKRCYWCRADCAAAYHVDHYEPLSKGGKHEVRNLVISCPRCNLRKSAKDPYEFAATLGRLF